MLKIRIIRVFIILSLILGKNIILLSVILSSGYFQSYLTHKTIDYFAKRYDINFSVEKIYIKFPNKLVFNDIYLEDLNNDTLFYSRELCAKVSNIIYLDRKLFIDKVDIIEPFINMSIDADGTANYEFLLEKFHTPEDTVSDIKFKIFCNNFNLINARINYKNEGVISQDSLFDVSNISITDLNVLINNFKYSSDTLEFNLKELKLLERSGFSLEEISSHVKIYDLGIKLDNFHLKTNKSKLSCSKINLSSNDYDYLSDPINKLNLELEIDRSYIDISDLGFFVPKYKSIYDKVYFSGNFNGKLSKFRLNKFILLYGNDTKLLANLSIDGLPDIDQTFAFGDIEYFNTSSKDINRFTTSLPSENPIVLPNLINELGNISFSGNLTGLFNDLVAYGKFVTDIGTVSTDIAVVSDFNEQIFQYKGNINARNINLGKILEDEETYGLLSIKADLNGVIDSTGNFSSKINCDISNIRLLDYNYTGIKIDGNASNNFYEGVININDPNLKLVFDGYYDKREEYPDINFETEIWADLQKLKLMSDTIPSEIKITTKTQVYGDLLNMPEGTLTISEFLYSKNQDSIKTDRFTINSFYDKNRLQHFTVRSDYIDADINGTYKFSELIKKISLLGYNYFPSMSEEDIEDDLISDNKANFIINIKNTDEITRMFAPQLQIEKEISVKGNLNTLSNAIEAEIYTPLIIYDSIYVNENRIKLKTFPDSIDISVKIEEINHPELSFFKNIDFGINIFTDSIYFNLLWDDYDSIRNSGDIKISSIFTQRDEHSFPLIKNRIFDSRITIKNNQWDISETPVIIDTSNISINKFRMAHQNQSLYINGEISKNPAKRLRYSITGVDVSIINSYLLESGFHFNGELSGNGIITNLYKAPNIITSLRINNFEVNDEDFGRFDISGNYNAVTGNFLVNGSNKYLKLKGSYVPETDFVNLSLNIEKFNLEILQPYLYQHNISELSGSFNIFLGIEGQLTNPRVHGYLIFNQAHLVYDYLKLNIFTSDNIIITNNSLLFNNFRFYDQYNNPGRINGGLYHNKFQDIQFDFNVNTTNVNALNTTVLDNSKYYGKVFANTNVQIKGTPRNYGVDINAKTRPNSVFVLPMTAAYKTKETGFVTFVKPESNMDTVNVLESVKRKTDFYIRIDIEVTPDTETQIVFDPKAGDIIRGNSQGSINMEYTSDKEFYMYGELEILEGDYLFTLQNVINKRFHITPGGTIIWDGDPYEGKMDLDAVYHLRAPLIDLMRVYEDTSHVYKRSTNVECHMHLSGNLMSPEISFGIKAPNADDKAQAQLANMSEDEINKQLLYLLILNRFYSPTDMRPDNTTTTTTNAFGVTSSELLSNQLSNWLSQISRDFDIGFNYRPGTEVSGQELEVALSTQVLNDRVLIDGNVGYGDDKRSSASNLVGDVEVQLKVNPKGSFRIKGFTRANEEFSTELGPYTSGMGVFYTEDFNTVEELLKRIYNTVTLKNIRDNRKEEESSSGTIL